VVPGVRPWECEAFVENDCWTLRGDDGANRACSQVEANSALRCACAMRIACRGVCAVGDARVLDGEHVRGGEPFSHDGIDAGARERTPPHVTAIRVMAD